MTYQKLESPRISLLRQKVATGDFTALEMFWQEILQCGAPLMEAVEGDNKHYVVTFLWRDTGKTQNVVIWGGPAGLDHPAENEMLHLSNTDLWYKTYLVQSDLRGVYTFTLKDSLQDFTVPG